MKDVFKLLAVAIGLMAAWGVQARTIDLGTINDAAPSFAHFSRDPHLAGGRGVSQADPYATWLQKARSVSGRRATAVGTARPSMPMSLPFGDLDLRRSMAAGFAVEEGVFSGKYLRKALRLGSVSKADFFSMLLIVAVLAGYQLRRKQKYLQHPLMM